MARAARCTSVQSRAGQMSWLRRWRNTSQLAEASTERHRRLAFTLSSFTFPLLGAALCFLVSWGGRLLPFFLGNLVVMGIFYPLLMVGTTLGERGMVPWLFLALPNLVLLALGVAMVRKVFRQ